MNRVISFIFQKTFNSNIFVRYINNNVHSKAWEFHEVVKPSEYVLNVQFNRPDKRNAMNKMFWRFE